MNFNSLKLSFNKNRPAILAVSACVMAVGATAVCGYVSYAHLPKLFNAYRNEVNIINMREDKTDVKSNISKAKWRLAGRIAMCYAGIVVLDAAAVMHILAGQKIMVNRNKALSAAVTSIAGSFAAYQERVEAKYGKEAADELKFDTKEVEVTTVDEDKNVKTETKEIATIIPGTYGFIIDHSASIWEGSEAYMDEFVDGEMQMAQFDYEARQYCLANDIRKRLGTKPSASWECLGKIHPNVNNGVGDKELKWTKQWLEVESSTKPGEYERVMYIEINFDKEPVTPRAVALNLIDK